MGVKLIPSQDELTQVLDYDPATGDFRWRARPVEAFEDSGFGREYTAKAWNARYVGTVAGTVNKVNGYRYIRLGPINYLAHRLAFIVQTGLYPEQQVDHINGCRDDNRWSNLREVSATDNRMNVAIGRNNRSGAIGVNIDKRTNKWRASYMVGGKNIHIGVFESKDAAIQARLTASQSNGFHPNHGRGRSHETVRHTRSKTKG